MRHFSRIVNVHSNIYDTEQNEFSKKQVTEIYFLGKVLNLVLNKF